MNQSKTRTSRAVRDAMVGKTIAGVIARPGRNGEPPMVMMMQFDDGSVVEFVSPRSDAVLERAITAPRRGARSSAGGPNQLALAVM